MYEPITYDEWVEENNIEPSPKKHSVQVLDNGKCQTIITKNDGYDNSFDRVAFEVMAGDNGTLTHICVALRKGKATILSWMKKYPSFAMAIEAGKEIGTMKFVDKLGDAAFRPTSEVNNGLIQIIARSVHGLDVDKNVNINVVGKGKKVDETARLYSDILNQIEVSKETRDEVDWAEDVPFTDVGGDESVDEVDGEVEIE